MMDGATVVVPSYNRPLRLRRCLDALMQLEGEPPEIIVVDDGSDEPLAPVCAQYGARVRCLRQTNSGPAAARNRGARAGTRRLIAFTDDDCRPDAGWLLTLQRAHGGNDQRLVGGRVENALTLNRFASASQALCDYLYEYFGASTGEAPFFTSNNMACSRDAFERLGGFDETFPLAAAEDRDFGLRWRASGGELVFEPSALVAHEHALDLRGFWRQHANYGRGARTLHHAMDRRGDRRPKIERLRFYTGLVSYPLREKGARGIVEAGLLLLSQCAMVSGYVTQMRLDGPRGHRRTGD